MQQQIGFCSTADRARIAYATVGTGPTLIFAQPISQLGVEWEEPRVRNFWETIGRHHMVIRYDKHGCGLSDRNRTDFSLDSEIRTIDAIVKDLGLKSFVLWARSLDATGAIAYPVKYPDRVSRLILYGAQARGHGVPSPGGLSHLSQETFRALVLSNWRMAQLSIIEMMLESALDAATLQWYLRNLQEGVTPEIFAQLITFWWNVDVRDLLPKVSVPTLVVHCRKERMIPFEGGRELAAGIPGARFVPLEGDAHAFYFGDTRPLLRAMKFPSTFEAVQGILRREGSFGLLPVGVKSSD